MKKIIFTLLGLFLLTSCNPTINIAANTKLKGNWELTKVEYYNTSGVIITVFDQADALCFEGSQWDFIPNNNTGKYTVLSTNECVGGNTNIIWHITKDSKFHFKKISIGQKGKQVTEGYTLDIRNQTDNSFELLQHIPFDGKDVQVLYSFLKK